MGILIDQNPMQYTISCNNCHVSQATMRAQYTIREARIQRRLKKNNWRIT